MRDALQTPEYDSPRWISPAVETTVGKETDAEKVARFEAALEQLIDRVSDDRYVLAMVLVGSLIEETAWDRESIGLWIIEADGVTRRLQSDGKDERVFRILCENGINVHAEIIPRSRFKQMVEGSSRTAFSCNYFARREVVYSCDPSIDKWFDQANTVAVKDREKELLAFSTWTIHSHRHAWKRLTIKMDIELARQEVLCAAQSVAHTEIIRQGNICEHDVIYKAIDGDPELFEKIYLEVLRKKTRKVLKLALEEIDAYLDRHYKAHLKPLLTWLKKQQRVVPLSEMSEHFAFTSIYPWHIESACEWLEEKGRVEKLATPFRLTKRSRDFVEEPAYFMDG